MAQASARHGWDERPADRRRYSRIGFDCPVRGSAGGPERVGWARDVSEGDAGFTIRAASAPQVGDRVRVIFELEPTIDWLVHEEATITRCDQRGPGRCEVGIRFGPVETRPWIAGGTAPVAPG